MQNIKMVDLHTQYLKIKIEVDQAIEQVINETAFINGSAVKIFSNSLASYCGINHVVTCGNGTDALQIAMMALEFKPGDEIIVPVHTYVATAEVIALLKLKPIFVDVDPTTFNIDTTQIETRITDKTVAIVPVHLYGQCADMEPIMTIAKKYNLSVIEDTAQALGATYTFSDGTVKKAGTMGNIGTTSFFPSKNLGCFGDGGALFVQDSELAKKCQMIANHGQNIKYHHDILGCNSRLDTIQAAVLNIKLRHLDAYSTARQKVAAAYDSAFRTSTLLDTPFRATNSTHVFHQYTLKVKAGRRDDLKVYLTEKGIPSMIYYPIPLHLQHAFESYGGGKGSFPVTEALSDNVLSLPIHTEMPQDQQAYIIDVVNNFK